jgi:hypothetical protein
MRSDLKGRGSWLGAVLVAVGGRFVARRTPALLLCCVAALAPNPAAALAPDRSAPSQALLEDATSYAQRYTLSLAEAVRRLQLQLRVGDLDAALSRDERSSFGGLWIQHEPAFRLVMAFTDGSAASRSLSAVRDRALDVEVDLRSVRWTLAELEEHQRAAMELATKLEVRVDADINVFQNRVEIYALEDGRRKLANAQLALPASVEVIVVNSLMRDMQLDGGEALLGSDSCTGGFTVRRPNGDKGILTAAHCPDTLAAQGQPLPFRAGRRANNHDVQWHSACGILDVSDNFNSGLGTRDCSGAVHRNNQPIGQYLCMWGMVGGRSCGTILSKSHAPPFLSATFVRVEPDPGGDPPTFGDSGGPVFVETLALGIITGGFDDGSGVDAIYMPINYIDILGVSVLTSDPPGPACNIVNCDPTGTACSVIGPNDCCSGGCVPIGVGGLGRCS